MAWVFNPPTVAYGPHVRASADPALTAWASYFPAPTKGRTVIKSGDTYTVTDDPYLDDILAADAVYHGGHVHPVSDDEAVALTAAGLGSGLSEV